MPLVRIALLQETLREVRAELSASIYEAMRETFDVPEGDRFMLIDEYDPAQFCFDPYYLEMQRTSGLVIVQITCNDTRTVDQKRSLYRSISDRLERLGVRRDDLLISLIEVKKEDWSFGCGEAQYA